MTKFPCSHDGTLCHHTLSADGKLRYSVCSRCGAYNVENLAATRAAEQRLDEMMAERRRWRARTTEEPDHGRNRDPNGV